MEKNCGITSRYKAFPPDGGPFKVVKLTFRKKLYFEERGWKFERTTLEPR
jgi:hypothetical protein